MIINDRTYFNVFFIVFAFVLLGCAHKESQTIVSSGDLTQKENDELEQDEKTGDTRDTRDTSNTKKEKETKEPSKQELETHILEDERLAAQILQDAMCGKNAVLAAWAAVYSLRLGIKHDEVCAIKALKKGVKKNDLLLSALCWRWLASLDSKNLPKWKTIKSNEPVVKALAAIAYLNKGELPKALLSSLSLPNHKPIGSNRKNEAKKRENELLTMALPFDDGALALSLAFVEARHREMTEYNTKNQLIFSSQRLRKELIKKLAENYKKVIKRVENITKTEKHKYSIFSEELNNRLITRPKKMLRVISVTGDLDLRHESLRALAITALDPLVSDIAASAAALKSDDLRVRIEAARTFLLLALRIRK